LKGKSKEQFDWIKRTFERRDDLEALEVAMPDLKRLERYERRVWSALKRAYREFIVARSTSSRVVTALRRTIIQWQFQLFVFSCLPVDGGEFFDVQSLACFEQASISGERVECRRVHRNSAR
jgi:hypothetical protein